MSGMQLNTDFSNIEPNQPGGQQFPPSDPNRGWLVKITKSEPKPTRKGDGTRCVLSLEGLEQPVQGMRMDYSINVANPNPESVRIGYAELSAIAHCVGILRVGNTVELHEKPFRVLVRKQADNPQYSEVFGVQDQNGNAPGKAGQGPLPAQTAQQNWGQPATQQQPQTQGQGQPAQGGGWNGQPAQGQGFQPGPGQGQQPQGDPNAAQGQNWQPQTQPGGAFQQQPQGQPGQDAGQQNWQPQQGGAAPNGAPSWATGGQQ